MRFRQIKYLRMHFLFFILGLFMAVLFGVRVSAAAVPVTAMVPVYMEGENTDETFTCHIEKESDEFQTIDEDTLLLKNAQSGVFKIRYSVPGTYRYKIFQEAGTDKKTTYDTTEYIVDVYVTEDENGCLKSEPVVYVKGSSEKKDGVSFRNTKTTDTASKTTKAQPVNTGDTTDVMQYILIFAGSLIILVLAGKACRKRGDEHA